MMFKRSVLSSLSALTVIVMLDGCKPRKNTSGVKIDSGNFVLDSGSYMPGVLPITGQKGFTSCTSTAVSDSTLITAAHCVTSPSYEGTTALKGNPGIHQAPAVCVTFPDEGRICTKNVFFPSPYAAPDEENMAYDLAVAVFPPKTFTYYHGLKIDEAMEVGKKVLMVGYSDKALYSAEFPKRWGANTLVKQELADVETSADVITFHVLTDRETVSASPGDSGGPLLNPSCELIAVASRASSDLFEEGIQKKFSVHVKFSTPRNKKFLEDLEKTVGANFCRVGKACDKASGFVKAVQVSDTKIFPCKAPAEDQDPKIQAALGKLAAARRQEIAHYGDLIACQDFVALEQRGSTGGTCFGYRVVERSDPSKTCDAPFISTLGEKMLTGDESRNLYNQKTVAQPVRVYLPDRARQNLENAIARDGEATLKDLKCTSKSIVASGCCLRASCKKILKFNSGFAERLGEDVSCPSGSEAAVVVKTWLSKYHTGGSAVVPTLAELERGAFPCYDRLAMALRKTTGICYELIEKKIKEGTALVAPSSESGASPDTSEVLGGRCWKVVQGKKTADEVACPKGLLEEETRIRNQ